MNDYPTTRLAARRLNETIGGPGAPLAGLFRRMPDSTPERLEQVFRLLTGDAGRLFPEGMILPAPVRSARKAFDAAAETAAAALAGVAEAREAAHHAVQEDAQQAAAALRGKTELPDAQLPARRRDLEQAELAVAGAEHWLIEAHAALVDTVREKWAELRRPLVEQGMGAHEAAIKALEQAAEAVEARRVHLASILALDNQVLVRFPEVKDELEDETRCGFRAFQAGVQPFIGRALTPAATAKVRAAFDTVRAHLAEETPWVGEWLPPGDPEREGLLQTPVDAKADWVRRAVFAVTGPNCPDCGLHLSPDVELDPATLTPMHEGCTGKKNANRGAVFAASINR